MARANGKDRGLWQPDPEGRPDLWGIQYAEKGKQRRIQIGTKAQAKVAYQEKKREIRLRRNAPQLAAEARGPMSFQKIMDDALQFCRRHAGYQDDVFRARRMCTWWGSMPATDLTPQEIERRFDSMSALGHNHRPETNQRPMSDATRNRYRSQLSQAYQLAQSYRTVPPGFNPARLVKLRKEKERVRWLSAEEERRLREVLARPEFSGQPWSHALDLALNCGLRWSDQRALTPAQREGDTLALQIGKTGAPLGLKLNAIAAEAWTALEEAAAASGREGSLYPRKQYRYWFDKVCKLAGIPDFHWHDLRHTYATRLLQAGVPMQHVQRLLGHKSIAMTQRYAHVVGGFELDALARLEEINRRCATGGAKVTMMPVKPPTASRRSNTN